MKKKIASLFLVLLVCFTMTVPAFADETGEPPQHVIIELNSPESVQPRMRNSEFSDSPFIGTEYQYTKHLSTRYGNRRLENLLVDCTIGALANVIKLIVAEGTGNDVSLVVDPIATGIAYKIKNSAERYAPTSNYVGYIEEIYEYSGSVTPTEHYLKHVIDYYPDVVSEGSPVPSGRTTMIFYEYSWFS